MIVPWAPGGAVDTVARIVAPKLSERLGKPVIVENRAGRGLDASAPRSAPRPRRTATRSVCRRSGSMAIRPAMYKSLPYDPAKDFAPMALIGRVPFVLIVHPSLPVKTVAELIAYAKTNKLFYGSGGAGLAASSLCRAAQEHDRHRDDARALQGQRRTPSRTWSPAISR